MFPRLKKEEEERFGCYHPDKDALQSASPPPSQLCSFGRGLRSD